MKKFKFLLKNKIDRLPKTAGVYGFKKGAKLLYVGKAADLRNRVKNHRHEAVHRLAVHIGYIETNSEIEALLLEAKLIKKYQPKYNITWKDDKNYLYVGITKEEFPRIFITHQIQNAKNKNRASKRSEGEKENEILFACQNDNLKLKINYLGPFVNGKKLKEVLKDLRKAYPFRTCKTLPKKPCLWYHLNQCPAPCLFKSRRIEAYDVSNIQGKDATGSMVTFINGKPDKNLYRRFKIKGAAEPNDLAMLKEVLGRRFNHPEWGLPDLILVDGGKTQLNAALSVTKIPAVALAKKKDELYMKNLKKPILMKNLPREVFNLILQLRDEAHRFAIAYHHKLRSGSLIPK